MIEDDKSPVPSTQVNESPVPSAWVDVLARRLIVWAAVFGASVLALLSLIPLGTAYIKSDPWLVTIARQHFAACVGMPGIAALSFLIVFTFEARFDAIEMEFFGIVKFKGAAGPIIL